MMQMFAIRKEPMEGNVRDLRLEGRGVTEAGYIAN
jgi:hypothetical protein